MRRLRLFLFLVVGVLLGGGCSMAFAQWSSPPPDIRLRGPNNLPFDYSTGKYVGFGGGAGGAANLNSSYAGRLGGALVPIGGTRTIPASALARLGMGLAKKAGPIGLGLTLADLVWDEANQQWMKEETPTTPAYTGWRFWDSRFPPCEVQSANCTKDQIIQAVLTAKNQTYRNFRCVSSCTATSGNFWVETYYGTSGQDQWQVQGAYYSCPEGFHLEAAGVCAADPVSSPATDSEIEQAILAKLIADSVGDAVAQKLKEAGFEPQLLQEAGPQNLSGPGSVPGPSSSSTSSGPSGQTTINQTITYNITYQGDTVTVSETINKTTTGPAGETTTESTTNSPTTEEPAEVPPEDPPKTDCEKFPRASGCEELGEVDDSELGQENETVSWSAEGSAAGSCPAPKQWNTQFGTYAIEWTPVCDFASGIRPFVVGIAWLGAGLFIFMVAKEKA